jgi:urease beta subunit
MFPAPYSVASQIQENQSRKSVTFNWKNKRLIQITQFFYMKTRAACIIFDRTK